MKLVKRLATIAVVIALVVGSIFHLTLQRRADDRLRLSWAAGRFLACVTRADKFFTKAATATPEEHVDATRIAAAWVLAAQQVSHAFNDELNRQLLLVGHPPGTAIDQSPVTYFIYVQPEMIARYRGPGVDPEIDRRIRHAIESSRIIMTHLDNELFRRVTKGEFERPLAT